MKYREAKMLSLRSGNVTRRRKRKQVKKSARKKERIASRKIKVKELMIKVKESKEMMAEVL
jgi:hypothetical protein